MEGNLQFDFVLVSPENDGNIGSVCRAIKNMGFHNLTIVGRGQFNREKIKTLAIHAYDIFEGCRTVSTLGKALEGSVLAAGVTRRRGRRRKYVSYTPEQFSSIAAACPGGTVAVVFGNEHHGLTDRELLECDTAVHIPSDAAFPSLNLSHAVQVIAYVLKRELMSGGSSGETGGRASAAASAVPDVHPAGLQAGRPREVPINRGETGRLVRDLMDNLEAIGFFTLTGKEEMGLFFRDILHRALLSEKEAGRLRKIFDKIEKLKVHRRDTGSTSSSM